MGPFREKEEGSRKRKGVVIAEAEVELLCLKMKEGASQNWERQENGFTLEPQP